MTARQRLAQVLLGLGLASLVAGCVAPLTTYYLGDQGRIVERVGVMPPLAVASGAVAVVSALAAWRGRRRSLVPLLVVASLVMIVNIEASRDPSLDVTLGPGLPLTVLGLMVASVGFVALPTRQT